MNIPGFATAGDTISWIDAVVSNNKGFFYNPGEYSLSYSLRGLSALDVDAAVNEGVWQTTITPAQSSALRPGIYYWSAYVSDNQGNRNTVGNGEIKINVDLSQQSAGYDGSSVAEQIIKAIDAEILGRQLGGSTIEYSIAGRSIRKESIATLQEIRAAWVAIYNKERRASMMAQGLGDPTMRFFKFKSSMPRTPRNGCW